MLDCQKALIAANGDFDGAVAILSKKAERAGEKKADRETKEGVVGSYIHVGDKVGVLVEINCETDFVARNESFRAFVKDVTLQIAAAMPKYVKREEVPASVIEAEKEPEKFFSDNCLLDQAFVKDGQKTIRDMLNGKIAELGENLIIRRFVRFQVGEPI